MTDRSGGLGLRWDRITQTIYKNLHTNGLFRLETSDQTYCEDDKLFLADRFVEGTCPNCGYDVSMLSYTRYRPQCQDVRAHSRPC
jgi:methionyl-tRNA synthetase